MMLNYGLSQGQNMFNQQKEKWMPGVSGFWDSLKIYFAVNNSYVSKKLFMILYPLSVTNPQAWARKSGEEGYDNGELRNKYALPKVSQSTNRYQYFMRRTAKQTLTNLLYSSLHYSSLYLIQDDVVAPDLYIPLMSFISYVLLYGLSTGLTTYFSPEILINAVWRCMVVQSCEVGVIMIALHLINSTLPFLDVYAYTGYKYVGLCVCAISKIFGSILSTIVILYTSGMLAYFIFRTMVCLVPLTQTPSLIPIERHWVLLGIALIQFMVALFLGWY